MIKPNDAISLNLNILASIVPPTNIFVSVLVSAVIRGGITRICK